MPIAAVPNYLGTNFNEASPGMRFGMYLRLWGINRRTHALLWQTHDVGYEVRGQQQQEREVKYENKVSALSDAKRLNNNDQKTMKSLLDRQKQTFDASAATDASLRFEALATAPFTTGLGNEHPLENGFAFLNPYGLPYLPGSGIKGVLRQAARELAGGEWGEAHGWSEDNRYTLRIGREDVSFSLLDALFGREAGDGDTEHLRGALVFWDVIPQIKGDHLAVEIMTPHQSHYYQNGENPHESGQPNPISFLTVPPGSGFVFHVQCNLAHLARLGPDLVANDQWKTLLEAAFAHAFKWLGFGAKTAVGYGVMLEDAAAKERKAQQDKAAADKQHQEQTKREREETIASMSPVDRAIAEFLDARQDKNQPELSALLGGLKQGKWSGELKTDIARHVENLMRTTKKWKEKSEKKNPDKDNDYQDTLKVMAWLQDK
jgi:CRISPR-associated protein Cmr6